MRPSRTRSVLVAMVVLVVARGPSDLAGAGNALTVKIPRPAGAP
jgi:hypothetical protein